MDSQTTQFKIVLLGEGAVGKSSLLLRYVDDKFNPKHLSTFQAAFATKAINVDGRKVELNIWDTAGQEKFHALGPIYYRDSQGAILVYDITDPHSFERVKSWIKELKRMLGEAVCIIIAGNKLDLEANRNVDKEEVNQYVASVGAQFQECSAKENLGVNPLFELLTRSMLEKAGQDAVNDANQKLSGLRRQGSRRSLQIVDDTIEQPASRKKCC